MEKEEVAKIELVRKQMIRQIKSVNKHMTDEYLKDKNNDWLLMLVHPTDFQDFKRKLGFKEKDCVTPKLLEQDA